MMPSAMVVLDVLVFLIGAVIVWVALADLFVAVVVPRPAYGRTGPIVLIIRWGWRLWCMIGSRLMRIEKREGMLGSFAPLALLVALATWVMLLIFGFGLILWSLRYQLHPTPPDLGTAIYFSAVSLLTIGFGDIVPSGGLARVVVLAEAGSGLGVVALTVSLLFSLYANFQKREVMVITLDALAGVPPSGVVVLENSKRMDMMDHLADVLDEWKVWAAEVLESHLAYPILNYFRSSHDNESWVSALGAVLDASTLLLTTVDEGARGPAKLMYEVGTHLVEDLSHFFNFPHEHTVGVERFEFDQARETLAEAGFRLRPADEAWAQFVAKRERYAAPLNAMAAYWEIPPSRWIGDRYPIRHWQSAHAAGDDGHRRPAGVAFTGPARPASSVEEQLPSKQ